MYTVVYCVEMLCSNLDMYGSEWVSAVSEAEHSTGLADNVANRYLAAIIVFV